MPLDHLCPPQAHQTASSTSVSRPPALTDRNPGMTTSSSSNDEAEKDKPNVTISSSSGEQWVKPRKIKSKRYVKRSAKVDQPTVDSTDEQEAEQAIKQRRKRKFVKRSNPVPLTTRSSEDEVASDDGEIFISPECPTANNLFTEEQRIKSGAAPLLTERRTKIVFGRVNPVPPLSSSDEEDEVATSGDFYISSESSTTNISSIKKKSEEEAAFSEEVNISSAPDYALPSSGEEAAELASPLPDQSPLDPEAFCMKFFQVIKKQSCIIKFI